MKKKYIPHVTAIGWSKKFQLYLKNYDICEYMKFVAILLKIDVS